ncbi:MAG TPA: fibronectin type III domain-containing protein [Candidatus Angelobacter sp.]|nr:fibronectin type III domain-containing protein [Candidatus Angelobacter sp.]
MSNLLKIAAVLLLCAGFAVAQTPATPAPAAGQQNTMLTKGPTLEFANANSAKIAWTSKQGADLVLQYSTNPSSFTQAVDAIEKMGGDNHRATMTGLQPNTTYYVRMTDKTGNPVGPTYSFKTPAQGQAPIHEQPLNPGS